MNHIRAWREFRGMTLQAVSDAIATQPSPGTLSSYESGKRKPSQKRLQEIADALRVSPGKLLDQPPPQGADVPTEDVGKVVNLLERMNDRDRKLAIEMLERLAPPKLA